MAAPRRGSTGDIHELIERARSGDHPPLALLVGTESFLIERATGLLRAASLGDGPAGFNDDVFHGAASLSGHKVVAAARTLPMMARARFVLVRSVENMSAAELEPLLGYVANPPDSTCLVLTAAKLNASTKLAKAVKKAKAWYDAKPLKGGGLRAFARAEAKRRGHDLTSRGAEALLEAIGDDLAATDDALERLSLYVGPGQRIDEVAVSACVSRIATDSIWMLVDAVGLRDLKKALAATSSLLGDREPPLRILGMVSRQLRIVAKMREALAKGLRDAEATSEAGAPPFKARELTESARRFTQADLAAAFQVIAEADLALKGSKVPPERVLEEAILTLCVGARRTRAEIPHRVRTYR